MIIKLIKIVLTVATVTINSCSYDLYYEDRIDFSMHEELRETVGLSSLPNGITGSGTPSPVYVGEISNFVNKKSEIICVAPSPEGFYYEYQDKKIDFLDNFSEINSSKTRYIISIKKALTRAEVEDVIDELKEHNINIEYIVIPGIIDFFSTMNFDKIFINMGETLEIENNDKENVSLPFEITESRIEKVFFAPIIFPKDSDNHITKLANNTIFATPLSSGIRFKYRNKRTMNLGDILKYIDSKSEINIAITRISTQSVIDGIIRELNRNNINNYIITILK